MYQDSDFFNCSEGISSSYLEGKTICIYIQEVSIMCAYRRSQERSGKEQQLG